MSYRQTTLGIVFCLASVGLCRGQAVQLPTFHHFTVNTTVSVPDGGSAFMGGVDRASYGSVSRGVPGLGKLPFAGRLFGNRAIGNSLQSSGVHVSATIIDNREIDEAILGQSSPRLDPLVGEDTDKRAAFLSQHVARNQFGDLVKQPTVTAAYFAGAAPSNIREAGQQHESLKFFQRAQQLESAGKENVAIIYYRMASRQATGPLREQALERLQALSRPQSAGVLADRRP